MRTREGFKLRTLGKDYILTAEGSEVVNFNKMISLNGTAAFLWKKVAGMDFTVEMMADMLIEKYGISKELALSDSEKLAKDWIEVGIVKED